MPQIITNGNTIAYADGAEQQLQNFFSVNNFDEYSIDLRNSNWPTFYHLSPLRKNLFNWINFGESSLNILELGAGCGALTSFFAGLDNCDVTAVEGSLERAKTIQARCKNANRLKIHACNIKDFSSDEKFDVVTLIGVLEYAGKYDDSENPFVAMLKTANKFLKEDGVLLLAIENQFGHKYLAGLPEDHYGEPYEGVNGYLGYNGVRTFDKETLHKMLDNSNFAHQRWYYPYPDYKLPTVILGEKAFQEDGFDILPLLKLPTTDLSTETRANLDERGFLKNLINSGEADKFMNSFLVIASRSANAKLLCLNENTLAVKINVDGRAKNFQTKTSFLVDDNSKIVVEREKLHDGQDKSFNNGEHVIEAVQPYHSRHINLTEAITDAVFDERLDLIVQYFSIWQRTLWELSEIEIPEYRTSFDEFCIRHFGKDIYTGSNYERWIDGKYLDFHPGNLLVSGQDDRLKFIDMEWQFSRKIPLQLVFDRGLAELSYALRRLSDFITVEQHGVTSLPLAVHGELGEMPLFKNCSVNSWRAFESWFQSAVKKGDLDYAPQEDFMTGSALNVKGSTGICPHDPGLLCKETV